MDIAELEKPPAQRRDPRSNLLKAQQKITDGDKVEICPYRIRQSEDGAEAEIDPKIKSPCSKDDMDEHGFCFHLIGFTVGTGNRPKKFEPHFPPIPTGFVGDTAEEQRKLNKELSQQMGFPCRSIEAGVRKTLGGRKGKYLQDVLKTDVLERISGSFRVYRNIERPEWAEYVDQSDDDEEPDALDEPKKKAKA